MHFDGGDLLCTEHFDNIVPSPAAHSDTWYVDGVEGSIVGTPKWVEASRKEEPDRRARFQSRAGGSRTPLAAAWQR